MNEQEKSNMTQEQKEVLKALREAGFEKPTYTRKKDRGGQFNLQSISGKKTRDLYIKEANPTIGFYGTGYETMRQWAKKEIADFVKRFSGWQQRPLQKRDEPKGPDAVWFNLERTTGPKTNWYKNSESLQNVIKVAQKLYEMLKQKGIFAPGFDPKNYNVNNAGNQTKEAMKNESTVESLLEANLNVILTGAPGTGKTYTAKEVAKAMVGAKVSEDATDDEKKRAKEAEEERIASVQFHPGYDYSDFVVGMKPKIVDGKDGDKAVSAVSFDWEDGVFKKFADNAKADLEHNYVFLIDEINRADLSRVFGELFSLLEEDYRYYKNEDGTKVNAKGITLPNGKNFVIPKNLYILGTMNDIDRSVESMDFALRRRFAWYEVTAESSMSIIDKKVSDPDKASKLKEKMKALNELIAPPQKKGEGGDAQKTGDKPKVDLRLGSEYQLGGAIFAKFEKYADRDDPFGELWRNHIENILKEYLRGRSNRDDLLAELEKVYNEKVKVADKSVDSASGGNGAEKPSTEGSTTNDKQE